MLILNPENLEKTQAPLRPEATRPARYASVLRVSLAIITTAAAFLSGYAVTQYFALAWPLWYAAAAIGGFVYLAALVAITVDGLRWHIPLAVIWGACFALGLPWRDGAEAFAMAGIVAAGSVLAYMTYASGASSFATLHTFTVSRRYASALASGIVLALIVLYGAALSRGNPILPENAFAGVADHAARLVPTFLPTVPQNGSSTLSVNDLARASVTAQLKDDPRFKALDPAEQQEVLENAVEQAAKSFTKQLGAASSSPDASVGSVTQTALASMLNRFRDQFGWYFIAAWLLGAFFVARSAAFVITLAIAGVVWLTVLAALSLGILRVDTIPAYRERLIL